MPQFVVVVFSGLPNGDIRQVRCSSVPYVLFGNVGIQVETLERGLG